jgi:hypothetical protein
MSKLQCARCLKDSDIHEGNKLELPVMCGGNRYPFGVMLPILCKSCRDSFEEWWSILKIEGEQKFKDLYGVKGCLTCNGMGDNLSDPFGEGKCVTCNGKGKVYREHEDPRGEASELKCGKCNGTGKSGDK